MGVHARPVLSEDRLGHKCRQKPVPVGDVPHHESERGEVVGRLEGLGIAEVDLVLPWRHLVVPGFDFEPHRDEILHDQAANFLGAIDRCLVEVAAVIVRHRGRLTVRVQLKDEKLGFDTGHHLVAERLRFRDLALQRLTRAAGERRAVRIVDVADHAGDLARRVTVRQHAEGVQIGPQHHVRFLDPDEAFDRRTVEHDVALERLFELALGHLDILVDAEDVGELEAQGTDVLLFGGFENLAFGGHDERRWRLVEGGGGWWRSRQ